MRGQQLCTNSARMQFMPCVRPCLGHDPWIHFVYVRSSTGKVNLLIATFIIETNLPERRTTHQHNTTHWYSSARSELRQKMAHCPAGESGQQQWGRWRCQSVHLIARMQTVSCHRARKQPASEPANRLQNQSASKRA